MNQMREAMAAVRYALRCRTVRFAFFGLIGAAAIWLGVMGLWWLPAQHEHEKLEQDITLRRMAVVDAANAASLREAHRRALDVIALYEKKLGARTGQAELIRSVARLAAQRGVRVVSQSFEQGHSQKADGAIYLSLGLMGSYPAVRQLLEDFESLPVWLEGLETHIELVHEGGGMVSAQLRLATYRALSTETSSRQ